MATNPQFPHDRDEIGLEPTQPAGPRGGRGWWTVIAGIATAIVIAALIYWLTTSPNRPGPAATTQVPPQPNGSQVELTNLQTSTPAQSGAIVISGNIVNRGNAPVSGVTVQETFKSLTGQDLQTITSQMQSANAQAGQAAASFATNPIVPGNSRPFVIQIGHPPEGWNRRLPELKITQVATEGGGAAQSRR